MMWEDNSGGPTPPRPILGLLICVLVGVGLAWLAHHFHVLGL